MTLNNLQKRVEVALEEVKQRMTSAKQRYKVILFDPDTDKVVYETPEEELLPLQPGEGRVVIMLPEVKEIEQGYAG